MYNIQKSRWQKLELLWVVFVFVNCENKKFRKINMNEVYPIAAVTLMYIDFFLLLIVKPFFFFLQKNPNCINGWIYIFVIKSLSNGLEIKLFRGFGFVFSPVIWCFVVLHDYTRSICSEKKNRSAIRSNILKKLCNGNVEQLDITGRGSPVILLNHVFWGKIDHRTMNDDE